MLLSGYKKQTILSLSYDFEILRKKKPRNTIWDTCRIWKKQIEYKTMH